MAVFKSLTFDGINSLNYGIYITGEAVYNAPERAVEMVTIPGRNGALAIDQGYFENIEVSYPCGCFADTQADFAEKVSAFRNAIASRYSYKRLTDEYNTDEYRLGLYKSGLEVDAVRYGTAGQFDITFDCKPQRFLLDGDAELSPTDYSDVQTVSGDIVQIENDGSLGVKSVLTTIEPIQSGSGTPSPDNVRPISGHTECVTSVNSGNFWDEEWEVGSITYANGTNYNSNQYFRSKNYIPIVPSVTYYLHSPKLDLYFYDKDKVYLGRYDGGLLPNQTNVAFTAPSNAHFMRLGSAVGGDNVYHHDISINYPSTDHEYHAYEGHQYTTSLGRTVYGGTLDVVSGVLTNRLKYKVLDGSENWQYNATTGGFLNVTLALSDAINLANNQDEEVRVVADKMNGVSAKTATTASTRASGNIALISDRRIYVTISRSIATNVTEFTNWLSQNHTTICYELSTPQTYQLTPQEVELLLGTNNLWTDCGDSTVEYGIPPYYNPTEFDAKPLIKVTGRGTLGIGEYILTITGTVTQTLYIDCETMEIYTLEGTVPTGASSLVSINKTDFPVLKPGHNGVSVGTGLSALTITPKWWKI